MAKARVPVQDRGSAIARVEEPGAPQVLGSVHFRSEYASPQNFVYPNIIYTDQELKTVSQPTLLLIGQEEALYNPLAAAKRARQLIPTIQAEIVPNAGHDMPVSRAEIVDEKVLAFLKSP